MNSLELSRWEFEQELERYREQVIPYPLCKRGKENLEKLVLKCQRNGIYIDPSIADMPFMVFVRIEQAKWKRKEKLLKKIKKLRKNGKKRA